MIPALWVMLYIFAGIGVMALILRQWVVRVGMPIDPLDDLMVGVLLVCAFLFWWAFLIAWIVNIFTGMAVGRYEKQHFR